MKRALAVLVLLAATATCARAQDLEPRSYVNTPVGINFFLLGYGFTTGGATFDAALPIENAEIDIHSELLAYAYSFGFLGRSGKIDAVLPVVELDGTAELAGEPIERSVSGLADSRLRLSYNLYGAPALTLEEHEGYKQNLLIGTSIQVFIPTGQYNKDRAINIGTNRWAFKPELGISKAIGRFTFELDAAVTIYTDNGDFFSEKTKEQDPLFALQAHGVCTIVRGVWAAVDMTWYTGGQSTVDGVKNDDNLSNLRLGGTLSLPISRRMSFKLYASTAAVTRVGGDFTTVGLIWQYRWGGGI